ncbi:pilus assembly protein [Sphingomonas sabuli]|uniref:Pilus assembly protein n=1 Tax=Sphingomonas sabuli TaxID=2764186 RepID=A0A7G9L4T1_9SPHN|nr:TadE/TadG family type IV pilus assembly protein [Sphingomonas sabuli]QNM83630.1 pilus assembly protein [Sphingomonas sabuli]
MIALRALGRDERGASVVELALIAPVLASLFVGMVDISRAYSFRLGLEQVVQRSIEKVMQYQESTSTYSTLHNETVIAANAAGYTDVASGDVVLDYWLECAGVRQASYDTNCSAGVAYARYVQVSVSSDFEPLFGTELFPGANSDGNFTITARAGMRTQ